MAEAANIIPMDAKRAEMATAVVQWVQAKRAEDALSREEIGALDAFDRIDAMRKSELVGMVVFCRENPRADTTMAIYHLIMLMADNDEGVCRVSQSAMATIFQRRRATIIESLQRLESANLIVSLGKQGRSAAYSPVISRAISSQRNHRVWIIDALRSTCTVERTGALQRTCAADGTGSEQTCTEERTCTGEEPVRFSRSDLYAEAYTTSLIEFTPNAHARVRESGCCDQRDHNRIPAVAAAVVAGIAVGAVALPAAATPVPDQKPAAVAEQRDGLAACWRTAKAQMAATLNTSEARAQRQVWVTDSGRVCIGEQFKAELAETFPLVDLTAGLAAAAPNVNPDHGALTAQKQILRQFGYMQQDALRRAAGAAARQPAPNALPPVKSFADRETESHNAWVRREAEKIRQRGPILPREEQPA